MTNAMTRRTALRGLVAGAVLAGWSATDQSWVTAAQAGPRGSGYKPLPRLDGRLELSRSAGFSKDYGNLVTAAPYAVLRPGSVEDIAKMIRYARQNKLKIAMNGQSGSVEEDFESHSNYGQALVNGGIAIDSRGLSRIHSIGSSSAVVDTGVTWAQLTDAAIAQGRTPVGLTDYMHLTVGGTISIGGIGGTVQKHGLLCDVVEEIQIVTGTGDIVTASLRERPQLFLAALAGGGQVGIITRAKVKLAPAPARAKVMLLFYNDLNTYLSDQEKVLADGRFSHQEGEIVRRPDDSGWRYKIEAVSYYTGAAPDQNKLLAGLRDDRASAQFDDLPYRDWVFRLDAFEAFLKAENIWDEPKPWLSLVLPASKVRTFVNQLLPELRTADLGAGICGLYPFKTSKLTRPLFVLPNEPVVYLFDLLRFPFPGDDIPGQLVQNRRLYDRGVALGAKRYIVGAVPNVTKADWKRHFGSLYEPFALAKRTYDPDNVLTPGQGFFG